MPASSPVLSPLPSPALLSSPVVGAKRRRRGMGWRKPVPKYCPSMPPSPPPSSPETALQSRRLSSPFAGAAHPGSEDVPPLPVDWRETIERVLTKERWRRREATCFDLEDSDVEVWTRPSSPTPDLERGLQSPPSMTALGLHFGHVQEVDRYHDVGVSDDMHTSPLKPLPPLPIHRKKSEPPPYLIYRPPTPPLSHGHYRKRRPSTLTFDARLSAPLSGPYQTIYPDSPLAHDMQDVYHQRLPEIPGMSVSPLSLSNRRHTQHVTADIQLPTIVVTTPSVAPSSTRSSRSTSMMNEKRRNYSKSEAYSSLSSSSWSDIWCLPWSPRMRAGKGPKDSLHGEVTLPNFVSFDRHAMEGAQIHVKNNLMETSLKQMGLWRSLWERLRGWGSYIATLS